MAAVALREVVLSRGGRRLLDGASFAVAPGEIAVLTGPTGAGKSAALALAALELAPEAGEVELLGARRVDAALRRRLGRATQAPELLPWMDAAENAALALRLAGVGRAERRARAEELLAWLGLPAARAAAPAGALSAGERRLTALARAAAVGAEVLILDEPTGDLDAAGSERVAELLTALAAHGAAVLAATGDEAFARRLARRPEARPLRLEDGRMAGRGAA